LKHTSSKVVITLYVYNEERRVLIRKIKRLEAILFPLSINSSFLLKQEKSSNKNKLLSIKEKLNIIKSQEDTVSLMN
jgi:hypothetical protein